MIAVRTDEYSKNIWFNENKWLQWEHMNTMRTDDYNEKRWLQWEHMITMRTYDYSEKRWLH